MRTEQTKILKLMFNNRDFINALSFMKDDEYFIGYEASARMSELRHHNRIGKYFINERQKNDMMKSKIDWERMEQEDPELFESIKKQINQLNVKSNDRVQEGRVEKGIFRWRTGWFSR